jgi:hypothetical protein
MDHPNGGEGLGIEFKFFYLIGIGEENADVESRSKASL